MINDLVFLLMGVMVMAMILAVVIVQARMSQRKEEIEQPVEEEKIYVDLGFEEPEDEPLIEKTEEAEPDPESIELNESQETFYNIEYETTEPEVMETPPDTIEELELVEEESEIAPMFEVSYEPSEPVIIETSKIEMNEYVESDPIVIETDTIILEEGPVEDPELQEEDIPIDEEIIEELVVEKEPEEIEVFPEVELGTLEETESVEEETPEIEIIEPEIVEERVIESIGGRERKPIRDESDPEINMDIGVKTCVNCGSEVPDTMYCIYCGKPIDEKIED